MTYVSSPSSSDQSQPPTLSLGSWGIPAKHLEREGPPRGQGQGPAGWGVPAPPLLFPPSLALPSSSISPLETEDLLFSIIYNLSLGPPVLSSH